MFRPFESPAALHQAQHDAVSGAVEVVAQAAEAAACTCGGACALHGDRLGQIVDLLQRLAPRPDLIDENTIQQEPALIIKTYGRTHNLIWCSAPVTVDISMADTTTIALMAGWNSLDLLDGTRVTCGAGISAQVLVKYTDHI